LRVVLKTTFVYKHLSTVIIYVLDEVTADNFSGVMMHLARRLPARLMRLIMREYFTATV